jgi:hypothetical protein
MKIIVFCLLILFCISSYSAGAISNDVLLEKLNAIQSDVTELNETFKTTKISRDEQIKDLNKEVIDLRVCQASTDTKLGIIWGVFGTMFGGGGVATFVAVQRKKVNGKTRE